MLRVGMSSAPPDPVIRALAFVRHLPFVMRIFSAVVFALGLQTKTSSAAGWPQFLGPDRSGIASDSEPSIERSFPSSGPVILWKKPLGTGFAGPVVTGGKVIVCHRVDDEVNIEALDAMTGKEVWKTSYKTNYRDSFGFDNGPRACPTVADGKVFVHGAEGILTALDLASGKALWAYDTVKELESPQGYFGRACAPLYHDGKVILTPGGRNEKGPAGVIALNAKDGSLAWQSVDDESAYSSPVVRMSTPPTMVCWMRNQLVLCNAADGKVLDSMRWRSEMDASVNASVPVWGIDDRFFITASYGVGGAMFKVDANAKLTKVWAHEETIDSHYSTPVFHRGHLYGFHGRQEQGQTLRCVSAEDGKVKWESPQVKGGTLLLVKETLVVVTESGELWLVEESPQAFNLLATAQILRAGHRSYPALSNGILYARDGKGMVAVDLRAAK